MFDHYLRKNDTDFDSYAAFLEKTRHRAQQSKQDREKEVRRSQMGQVREVMPDYAQNFSTSSLSTPTKRALEGVVKADKPKWVYVYSDSDLSPEGASCVLLRALIAKGCAVGGEVAHIDEADVASMTLTGFSGRGKIEELLQKTYSHVVFLPLGSSVSAKEQVNVERMLSELARRDIWVIITGYEPVNDFISRYSRRTQTMLRQLLKNSDILLEPSEEFVKTLKEERVENEAASLFRGGLT